MGEMRTLTTRELVLLGVMIVLAVVFFMIFNTQGQRPLPAAVKPKIVNAGQLDALEQQWRQVESQKLPPLLSEPLYIFLEKKAEELDLIKLLELNELATAPEGQEGVGVELDRIYFDKLIEFLYALENNKPVILVRQLDITLVPGTDLLRASFQTYKQTNL